MPSAPVLPPNPRRSAWAARAFACFAAASALALAPQAWADAAAEYRVKAAFLFNFASFTEWPARTGPALTICIYGDDPFGANLDAIAGKTAGGRRIEVRRAGSVDKLADCQVVFISRATIGNLGRVFDTLGSAPVLTVADSPGAMRQGVMLNMDAPDGKVTFSANLAAARRQGLNLSSKLLSLATEVNQ